MHPVVNHLVQLQELVQIREEQMVTGREHLESLNASIKSMIAKLPPEARSHFTKLNDRKQTAVVPLFQTVCSGCGMSLATSLVQAVRQGRTVQYCPNCARVLYEPGSKVRRVRPERRRTPKQKSGVARFSAPALMIPSLKSKDVEGAIRELVETMEQEGFLQGADPLIEAALQREATLSTAVGEGVAFPHVRQVEGGGLAMAVGISRSGIRWAPKARRLTRLVFFVIIPTAASAFYLKLLSGLSQTFMDAEARQLLMAEKEPETMWKTLVKLTRKTVK